MIVDKIKQRKNELNMTFKNLSKLSGVSRSTINKIFNNKNVRLNTIAKITNILGLDLQGNEIISVKELIEQRAKVKSAHLD